MRHYRKKKRILYIQLVYLWRKEIWKTAEQSIWHKTSKEKPRTNKPAGPTPGQTERVVWQTVFFFFLPGWIYFWERCFQPQHDCCLRASFKAIWMFLPFSVCEKSDCNICVEALVVGRSVFKIACELWVFQTPKKKSLSGSLFGFSYITGLHYKKDAMSISQKWMSSTNHLP